MAAITTLTRRLHDDRHRRQFPYDLAPSHRRLGRGQPGEIDANGLRLPTRRVNAGSYSDRHLRRRRQPGSATRHHHHREAFDDDSDGTRSCTTAIHFTPAARPWLVRRREIDANGRADHRRPGQRRQLHGHRDLRRGNTGSFDSATITISKKAACCSERGQQDLGDVTRPSPERFLASSRARRDVHPQPYAG